MEFDYETNINSISGFYDNILRIKDDFFAALFNANYNLYKLITDNGSNPLKQRDIKLIFEKCTRLQRELEKDFYNINEDNEKLAIYKVGLEQNIQIENFDTMSPQIMARDTVALYNLQYLQIFCKVLGIIIIIFIFWKYFSSITGMSSLPSVIPQSLPQVSLPQVAST